MAKVVRSNFTNLRRTSVKISGVYELVCLPTGERYIGSSYTSMLHRAKRHRCALRKGEHYNAPLQEHYLAYGEEAFELWEYAQEVDLLQEENRRIAMWRRSKLALNYQGSHDWRAAVSKRVKEQHADGNLGRATWGAGTAESQAKKMLGKPNAMRGQKYGPEHGQKIAAKLRGVPKSPEHIRAALEGRNRAHRARWLTKQNGA